MLVGDILTGAAFSPHALRPKEHLDQFSKLFPSVTFGTSLLSTNLFHCDSPIMVLISSKTLIQAHAVFLVVIAGYLVKSPEVITDCDLVFMMGEALKIVRRTNMPDSQAYFYHIGNGSS